MGIKGFIENIFMTVDRQIRYDSFLVEPSDEWLRLYKEKREYLISEQNFWDLFEIVKKTGYINKDGDTLHVVKQGTVTFPTGYVIAADPLKTLNRDSKAFLDRVDKGTFPIESLVIETGRNEKVYAATRVRLSNERPDYYIEPLTGEEDLERVDEKFSFGFYVSAGLATIVDVKTRDEFLSEREDFSREKPNNNVYRSLYYPAFKRNLREHPRHQEEFGSWVNYKIKDSDLSVPMVQAGTGVEKYYPVYFGYNDRSKVLEIILSYININPLY